MTHERLRAALDEGGSELVEEWADPSTSKIGDAFEVTPREVAYIAAADPSTIRELLAECDALAAVAESARTEHWKDEGSPYCPVCLALDALDRAVSKP